MHECGDEELMMEWAAGKMEAFELLYARHRAPLYRYILRQVRDEATANDLYQGSWEKMIRGRKAYRPQAPFRAWMYRVAHNHVMDHFRRRRPDTGLETELLESGMASPEEELQLENRASDLREAVALLPDKQKDAILLKLDAGLDLQSIADVLGVNRETAKSRLRYAVSRLKNLLTEPVT